jgi:hypothetical protein
MKPRAAAALLALAFAVPARAELPASLRDTGLFEAGGDQVRPENLPFTPQYPLWSDGAGKRRWIHLPPGTRIDASGREWSFPVGTRLWKEFSVAGRPVETRVLERTDDGWSFAAYVWNDTGTDATRAPAAGTAVDLPGRRYLIPGETDCRSCHEGRATPVLGFTALQLATGGGNGSLDLRALAARGLVSGLPREALSQPPRLPGRTAIERAALGYLYANCGHCHNATGPLAGLELNLDAVEGAAPVLSSTVGRPSRYLPPGATGEPVRIAAGRPDLSVVIARMRSRDPLVQMPPVGTQLADQSGLALIERWIRETNPKKETAP